MLDRSKATVQAEPRIPKPETLEAKFKLMTVLPFDARIRRRHMVVFGFVVDWFHSKYGDALASVRHVAEMLKERDPSGAGLSTSYVHNSLSELVAWGYLRCEAGIGKRASRYVPNWDLVCTVRSVHPVVDATSVHNGVDTDVHPGVDTNRSSVHPVLNEDPSTGPGYQTRELVEWDVFDAPASPPPPGGLGATGAGGASGDGFTSFWLIWPRKHGKKKAEAEWKKLDPEQQVRAADEAARWASHYRHNATPMKYVAEPANWLRDERFDEDLPLVHADRKGAAISKAKANVPSKTKPEPDDYEVEEEIECEHEPVVELPMINDVGMFSPRGVFTATIVDSRVQALRDVGKSITLTLEIEDDRIEHTFFYEANDYRQQERGVAFLCQLRDLAGLDDIEDTDQLHGLCVSATITPQLEIKYAPAGQKEAV